VTSTDQRISDAAVRLFAEKGATGVTVSELAQHANVTRETVYRIVGSVDGLFDRIVGDLSDDLHRRVSATFSDIEDPAARLATGVRLWVRYAHENPTLGRFAVKFGLHQEALRSLMTGPAMLDVSAGISAGRYKIATSDIDSVASMVLGATISAMWMVLEGHQTWRDAGYRTAELLLRALGIDATEAHDIAGVDLPPLPAQ
jgi:AcrR family transcriptional regulator